MHGSSAALQGVCIIKGAKINSGNKPSSEQKRSVLPDRERLELARSSGLLSSTVCLVLRLYHTFKHVLYNLRNFKDGYLFIDFCTLLNTHTHTQASEPKSRPPSELIYILSTQWDFIAFTKAHEFDFS